MERPFVPVNLKYILKSKKGVGTIYTIFHTNFQNYHKMKSRWNQEFEKGMLSTTLRKCVITCIPKGNKSRTQLKNWRPISLLCVTYKLASGAIANRLKRTLKHVISQSQTGFIEGRQISDSTQIIYNIMHFAEVKNKTGLLMMIDF